MQWAILQRERAYRGGSRIAHTISDALSHAISFVGARYANRDPYANLHQPSHIHADAHIHAHADT